MTSHGPINTERGWQTASCDCKTNEETSVYSTKVRSKLTGVTYLEMWARGVGIRHFSRGMNDPVEGHSIWKTIQTPFRFQKEQQPDKVVLNIVINGTGTVWVDDLALTRAPLN